jgi:hypothetical protein
MRRATRRDPDRHHEEATAPPPRLPVRGTPANENEPAAAEAITNIKRRPSATPFWVAFAVSLIWIFACIAIYGPILFKQGNLLATSNLPQLMTASMVIFLPIGLAWTSAYLLYRAQQLRHVSEALMQTAMRLVRPQDIAAESLSSVAQTVREEVNLLVGGVEQAVQRATQLEELVHKEMAAIERAFGGNEERIRNLIAGLEAQREALHQAGFVIGAEATPLLGRLEENTQHLDGIINAAQSTLAALEQGLKTSTTELAHTIDEVAARAALVGDQISSQTARMEQMSSVLLSEVQGFSDHITNQVETLAQTSGNMNLESTNFSQSVKAMETSIVESLKQSVAELSSLHAEAQQSVDLLSNSLNSQLQSTSQQFAALLQSTGSGVNDQVRETATAVAQLVERSGREVSEQIQISGDSLAERLLSTSGDFVQNVARARSELFNYMEESSSAMTNRLEEATNQLFGKIEEVSTQMTDQLATTGQRVTEQLDEASSSLTGRLDETTSRLFTHVDRENTIIFSRLEATSNEVAQKLENAGNNMFIRIDTTARNLGERFDVATELLERVTTDITGRMEVTSAGFGDVMDRISSSLDEKISGSQSQFAQILDAASANIFTELGKATSAFTEGLGASTLDITGRFQQTTGILVGKLEDAAGSFTVRLDSTNNAFVGALTEATHNLLVNSESSARRIDEAGEKFAKHVESSNRFFAEQLGQSATMLDERLESVSMQLTGKLEVTGTKLSERLEDVSLLVEKSVSRFNTDIERVLHSREDVLEALIAKLGKRAEDVDAMMRNYMTLIEESLTKSDARAREIGHIISTQAETASQSLSHQIKQLEETADTQIASAARQLREQYERAVNTMNEMLSMTAGEFTQTAQDMRVTAQQVVRDVDSARNELRQIVMDLPDETRTNATAMRKVIADQIEALNSLADVVKRHTSGLDLSGPGIYLPGHKEPGKQEGGGKAEPAGTPAGAALVPVPRHNGGDVAAAQTIRGRSVSAILETEAPSGSSDLLPQLKTEGDLQPASRGKRKADAQAISRETETLVAKLNSASRDLVEAIDGKLPADLERRFDGGEQHVYTHRLYQGRGKKMLELLKDRYANERLIRGRIDAFARMFERLLDTVSETTQGEQLVDACLASESGRLYLMLAQASGRLAG